MMAMTMTMTTSEIPATPTSRNGDEEEGKEGQNRQHKQGHRRRCDSGLMTSACSNSLSSLGTSIRSVMQKQNHRQDLHHQESSPSSNKNNQEEETNNEGTKNDDEEESESEEESVEEEVLEVPKELDILPPRPKVCPKKMAKFWTKVFCGHEICHDGTTQDDDDDDDDDENDDEHYEDDDDVTWLGGTTEESISGGTLASPSSADHRPQSQNQVQEDISNNHPGCQQEQRRVIQHEQHVRAVILRNDFLRLRHDASRFIVSVCRYIIVTTLLRYTVVAATATATATIRFGAGGAARQQQQQQPNRPQQRTKNETSNDDANNDNDNDGHDSIPEL